MTPISHPVIARVRVDLSLPGKDASLLTAEALGVERLEMIERCWSKEEGRETTRYQLSCRQDQNDLAQILSRLADKPRRLSVHWARMAE